MRRFQEEAEHKRLTNLTLNSKTNLMKERLKKLVKKIMTYVSELSITQALLVKTTQERDDLQEDLTAIQQRVQRGLPPTDFSEYNFMKILRDQKTVHETNLLRKQQAVLERQVFPFQVKTTAPKRATHYLNEMGLPQPFQKQGPIKPQKVFFVKNLKRNNFLGKASPK